MAQNDTWKRYLDAGMAFTQMTRDRAEAIVQELVKAGEVRRKEAEKQIEDLLERSRKNTEDLVGLIRREVAEQLHTLGLDELAKRAGVAKAGGTAKTETKKAASANRTAADSGATQTSAPVVAPPSAAKTAAAKKGTAAAAKDPATKKKATATKAAAKKTTAKKA